MNHATNYYTKGFVTTGLAAACALTKIDAIARPVGESVIADAIAISQLLINRTINNGIECREAFEAWGGTQRIVLEALRFNAKYEIDVKVLTALRVTFVFLAGVVGFAWGFVQGIPGWIDTVVEQSQEQQQQQEEAEDIEIGTVEPLPVCPESGETSDALLMAEEPIQSAPIDWAVWAPDDLKKASQRAPFNIPLRIDGKVATKPQLIELYQQAVEGAAIA